MKIVYFIPGVGVSGGIAVICQHANRLLKRGHQVYLVTEINQPRIDWFPEQKVPVININEYPEDVDILIATGWSTSFTIVNLPAKRKFYFVQSDETRFHPEGSDFQGITALSYLFNFNYFTEARWIQKWLSTDFDHDSELIPNGLDSEIFFPSKPLVAKAKRKRVLLEGAIDLPYKGMAEAFSAVSNLDVEVWCVSSLGNPKPKWRCDRFFSEVPISRMRKIYSSCDVLLKLSRVEGFFGPPLEMMACGGTVVVGKVTGYDEYIEDGYNALVVDAGDITAASSAVAKLIYDNELRSKLIANGLITAKKWQWEPSIDRLEAYFQRVLDKNQGNYNSVTRQLANQSVVTYYQRLLSSSFNNSPEPMDIIYSHVRQINWLKRFSCFIYKIYKNIKRLRFMVLLHQ
jgi:glycosyltransferase involved in cell wall biosynthesis